MTARLQYQVDRQGEGGLKSSRWHGTLRQAQQQRPTVGHRTMELIERDVEGNQPTFMDRAVLKAMQRIAQYAIGLVLHPLKLFDRFGCARVRAHLKQALAQMRVVATLVPL